jgi:cytochrome c nitrite reductase small subunit
MIRTRSFSLGALLLSMSLGLFGGVGTYTFYYANGASYLSNDPKACVNCHIMREQYDGWQKASHHAVATCNDCHVPHDLVGKYLTKAENGFMHSKAFTFENFHEPIQMRERSKRVVQNNCLYCHSDLLMEIVKHPATESEPMDCIRCHRDVGHGPTR